ncbi:YdcF family protein [Synechococcus sp. J7-Johnson]|uniref:YdcF family protein n=1 Tax=Synechococcus sp. J7-Johnson TaxID=2823737 RepID=UPI0020CCA646|nr:YdcF family protein [Synechococcus sp. J7-Johnson]MCP9840506.1 YdcF family protein [Synechococcus sp. J7-Johnson]
MGFLFSKLLPQLLYPLSLGLLLALAGLLVGPRRRWSGPLGGLGMALLWISAMPLTARELVWGLEARSAALTPSPLPRGDAIVVLGGGLRAALPPRSGVEVNEAGDRLLSGIRLLREERAPLLLLSGGRVSFSGGDPAPAEAISARNLALELGVPADRLLLSDQARTTAEEAKDLRRIGKDRDWSTVLLVTSALHMPRALASFRRQSGLKVVPVACDYLLPARDQLGTPTAGSVLLSLWPDAGSLLLSSLAVKEHLGLLVYRLKGWS